MKIDKLLCNGRKRLFMSYHHEGSHGSSKSSTGRGLGAIKQDPALRTSPVIILTSSYAEGDVLKSYDNHANAYVTKPVDLEKYFTMSRPPR